MDYGKFVYDPKRLDALARAIRAARRAGAEVAVMILPVHALHLETARAMGLWEDYERWKTDLAAMVHRQRRAHRGKGDWLGSAADVPVPFSGNGDVYCIL